MTEEVQRMIGEVQQDTIDCQLAAALAKQLNKTINDMHDRNRARGMYDYMEQRSRTLEERLSNEEREKLYSDYREASRNALESLGQLTITLIGLLKGVDEARGEYQKRTAKRN